MDFSRHIAELKALHDNVKQLDVTTKHGLILLSQLKCNIYHSTELLKKMRSYDVIPSYSNEGKLIYILANWTGTDWEKVKEFDKEPTQLEIELVLDHLRS